MWKNYEKFANGCYQVSTNGEVRSVDRIIKTKRGEWKYKGKLLAPNIGTNGYYYVNLSKAQNKKTCYIHNMVAETFLEKEDETLEVDHINGNKLDNRLENLQYLSHFDNSSKSNKGKKRYDRHLEKNPKTKKVIGVKNGVIVEHFDCAKKITLKYGINYSTLKQQLRKNNCKINGVNYYYETNIS